LRRIHEKSLSRQRAIALGFSVEMMASLPRM